MRKILALAIICTVLIAPLTGCAGSPVNEASDAINAIGKVSLQSGEAIEAAQAKYDALSDEEKGKVENYSKLQNATSEYQELLIEKDCFNLIESSYLEAQKVEPDRSSASEMGISISEGVSDELSKLASFDDSAIANKDFRELFGRYKQSLQSQIDGLSDFPNNPSAYNEAYLDQGKVVQNDCLATFESSYGLALSADYGSSKLNKMGVIGTPYSIDTEKGKVVMTVEGFSVTSKDTETVRQVGMANDSQECGFLLCVINNASHPVSDEYSGRLRFDELGIVASLDGVQLATVDGSLRYPGYECGGAGVLGIYNGSEVKVGETKRISIPYVVDSGAKEVLVSLKSGEFLIVPIVR
ncbi:hypothetical protein [uncultured Senegalimassilia sp.]|uniref:hypothetical protein n=1 Tax=uncultured Senegalimassilia sp. TaxID=1714350 RepID=UPI0025F30ABE|nr:hypothetical protein [uncultured Senegalimassilia sp.]